MLHIIAFNSAQRNKFHNSPRYLIVLVVLLISSFSTKAQLLHNSLSPETQYPDAALSPTTFNLDKAKTKYLTNFAYPAPAPFPSGSSLELAGWSTDIDGGFTFGESAPPLPPLMSSIYTGHGAVSLPNVRDVQVGYLKNGSDHYIIAAYYDNVVQLYGYSLYSWDLVGQTATFLYTLHFQNPNFAAPAYTPNNGYIPVIDGLDYPDYPPPTLTSTMAYNRISMDIHKDANKVAIVLSDGNTGLLYTTAGQVGLDTVIFCPNLPPMPTVLSITTPPPYIIPTPEFDYFSGLHTFVLNPSTGDYDYFDIPTGIHVRYLASMGSPATYLYSYYPIDKGLFISEFIRYSPTSTLLTQMPSPPKPPSLYAPLIRLKPVSAITIPCSPYYFNYLPDVAFGGDNLSFVFYNYNLADLYVNDHSSPISFNDLYTYTGGSIPGPYCVGGGQTDMAMTSMNTADGLYMSSIWIGGAIAGIESSCPSLGFTPPAIMLDIWPKIDAPDLGGGKWAVTFAYKPNPTLLFGGTPYTAPGTSIVIHEAADDYKNNIYVRSNFQQSILTNGSMGNAAINVGQNVSPSISFKTMSTTNVSVAWASEEAGLLSGSNAAYIGTEINTTLPFGTTSPSSLVTLNDYLHVSGNPNFDAGNYPSISLSKHTDGLSYLYSAYAQEDAMGTYSLMHKNKPNASTSFWKTTGVNIALQSSIAIAPNPFSNSLHISSTEPLSIVLTDLLGRSLANYEGSTDELNKKLDVLAPTLVSGTYLLKTTKATGQNQVFKLTKQ